MLLKSSTLKDSPAVVKFLALLILEVFKMFGLHENPSTPENL
jgi:hypothetical protein